MSDELNDFLEHHGVKGMKWGVRRDRSDSSGSSKKESRKEYRSRVKQEKSEFYDKKIETVVKAAQKSDVLIKSRFAGDTVPTVATGKEFVDMLAAGRAFDVKTTEIFATLDKKQGAYVINDEPIGNYKKTGRRRG